MAPRFSSYRGKNNSIHEVLGLQLLDPLRNCVEAKQSEYRVSTPDVSTGQVPEEESKPKASKQRHAI
jgi:hypothetical protein